MGNNNTMLLAALASCESDAIKRNDSSVSGGPSYLLAGVEVVI
jgi:hypothetical protein